MSTGKNVGRDAIHCSTSPARTQARSCPGRVGVGTVSPEWDCSSLLWSATLAPATLRRGTLCWSDGGPNKRSTRGQEGGAHRQDDSNGGCVGQPTCLACIEDESEGSGTFLISNRGVKQKGWASRY